MRRREFWHKHLFLKQMLPCKSAEEKPVQMEQWTILGNRRDRRYCKVFRLFLAGLNAQMALCVEAVNFGGHFGGDRRYHTEANCSVRSHRAVDHLIPASL